MQQGQYQMYQPMYQQPQRSTADMMKHMFLSNLMIGLGVTLGLILMWLGSIITGLSTDVDVDKMGLVIKSIGTLALTGVLLLGGIARQDMERWVRVVMIFSAALIIIFVGFWAGFVDLSSLNPF